MVLEGTMNCPDCKTKMEGEAYPQSNGPALRIGGVRGDYSIKVVTITSPTAHFYCGGCYSEWTRSGTREPLRKIDGAA